MDGSQTRGTPALHLNEPTWIIDGFNELIVDFLFALVIFLDSTQPRAPQKFKIIFFSFLFLFLNQTNEYHVNTIPMPNQTQASITAASTCRLIQMQGWFLKQFYNKCCF